MKPYRDCNGLPRVGVPREYKDYRHWENLTKDERRVYMQIQMARSTPYGASGRLPCDCSDCGACGMPMLSIGICDPCYRKWKVLDDKLRS